MSATVPTLDDLRAELDRWRRNPPPPKLALTVAEAVKATGAGQTTIRRWVRDGLLPTVPHTSRVLIPTAALERFVLGDASTPAGHPPAPAGVDGLPGAIGTTAPLVDGPDVLPLRPQGTGDPTSTAGGPARPPAA